MAYSWRILILLAALPLARAERPNVLVAVSDDQSWPHASAYGFPEVSTPAFDRVAASGALFLNAFSPAPGCSPMRAAFLTGRQIWQLEQAGTHASSFPARYRTFPELLEESGYAVGYTGKGWSPGNWRAGGRSRNPAGRAYSSRRIEPPHPGMSKVDYAANFAGFLEEERGGRPFCFWYGASEPHRRFARGSGLAEGKDPSRVRVPPFLPDLPEVRGDILDYLVEIEWFDRHLGRMLDLLEERGELGNTLVIVTSDNGMAFPRAKANLYEYGIHMPLAVSWPARVPGGRRIEDPVGLIDVTATILEAARTAPPFDHPISGRSLSNILFSDRSGAVDPLREAVYSGRERHSSARYSSLGYPQRCIRTREHLLIWNMRPERWPAGAPRKYGSGSYPPEAEVLARRLGPEHGGYHDIDACPTLDAMIGRSRDPVLGRYLRLATGLRPERELYRVAEDPGCLVNLAGREETARLEASLMERLEGYLRATGDPRVIDADGGDVFETYPRYSPLRWFPEPDWAREASRPLIRQDWLEERRP